MLTFPAAFLYRRVASWISSRTSNLPSPHGTTTLIVPKQTVTFIIINSAKSISRQIKSDTISFILLLLVLQLLSVFVFLYVFKNDFLSLFFRYCNLFFFVVLFFLIFVQFIKTLHTIYSRPLSSVF